jgi:hypothetical protein
MLFTYIKNKILSFFFSIIKIIKKKKKKKVNLPAMSAKDKEDIRYGIEKDMDFVAASFVRKAEDIFEIRAHIEACHAEFWPADYPKARIIAKVTPFFTFYLFPPFSFSFSFDFFFLSFSPTKLFDAFLQVLFFFCISEIYIYTCP